MTNSTDQIQHPLVKKQPTYKSMLWISLMAWSLAMAVFHFGFYLVYVQQIPTQTIKEIYGINLQNGLTEGILNGLVPVGALFGALSSSFFIGRYSRRTNMLIANAFCFTVGCLIYIQYFPVLIFCRFCQGFGMGFFTSITPLIIRQLSPTQISGAIGSFTQINICIGIFTGCFSSYCMLKVSGDDTAKAYWFLVFAIPQAVITIQTILLVFVFPYQTPKYLLIMGKQEEARKLIQIIYKPQYVDEILQQKKEDIKKQEIKLSLRLSQQIENKKMNNNKNTFFTIPNMVSIHIVVLQQVCGVNVVAIYSKKISQEVATGQLALILPSSINFLQVFALCTSCFLLNKVGRRAVFVYGTIITALANILMMVGYFLKDSSPVGQPLIIFGMFMFIVVFGLSLGPAVWSYVPQIIQPDMIPYTTTASWISASIIIILFPILTQDYLNGNPALLFIFSTTWCLASIFVNYFYVLETKDKTEKEIREQFKQLKICQG